MPSSTATIGPTDWIHEIFFCDKLVWGASAPAGFRRRLPDARRIA
jgi:hypothetical protein